MYRNSSAGLSTRGRCKAPYGARECSGRPEAFPHCVAQGRVLRVRSCSKGVIYMPARGYAASVVDRVLDRPSRDSGSTAIVLSFGGAASADPRAADALATMRSFFNVDSIVMTRRLIQVRNNYFIPSYYELHAPLPGEHPYNAFLSDFILSADALESGLRFLLHPMIGACLEGWQISPSQMAPNSWRYLVAFLWECYGSGTVAT
ncbi:hypothetical protein BHE74_00029841 [Ensete ventricosum]|nr:hypothetical protein BHE74_00029841 [Ensete ventricosum]